MVKKIFQKLLIQCCAPTLAGIKLGSLFSIKKEFVVDSEIKDLNLKLRSIDIQIEIVRKRKENFLIYVYNEKLLEQKMNCTKIRAFLHTFGYLDFHKDGLLEVLKERLSTEDEFPHEIGIFLDYPLCDVEGFINNKGNNFIVTGLWKVYGDAKSSKKIFESYCNCKTCFIAMYNKGYKTMDIIKKYNGGTYEENSGSVLVGNGQYGKNGKCHS